MNLFFVLFIILLTLIISGAVNVTWAWMLLWPILVLFALFSITVYILILSWVIRYIIRG